MSRAVFCGVGGLLLVGSFLAVLVVELSDGRFQRLRGTQREEGAPAGGVAGVRALAEAGTAWWGHGGWGHRRHYGGGWGWGYGGYGHGRGWGWDPYGWSGHHHGWNYWYALPGLKQSRAQPVDNMVFWTSVFDEAKFLRSFAVGLVSMGEEPRKLWEEATYREAEGEVFRSELELWEAVFTDRGATRHLVAWLAELGGEERAVWESRVAAALASGDAPPWKPPWKSLGYGHTKEAAAALSRRPLALLATGRCCLYGRKHYLRPANWGTGYRVGSRASERGRGGGWHRWTALPEADGGMPAEVAEVPRVVSNEELWSKVFAGDRLLVAFALWLGRLDAEERREWQNNLASALDTEAGETSGRVSSATEELLQALLAKATDTEERDEHADQSTSGDVTEVPSQGKTPEDGNVAGDLTDMAWENVNWFWDMVFEDENRAASFAAWLGELGNERRLAWEQRVSEAAFSVKGKVWQPSWPRHWDFSRTDLPQNTVNTNESVAVAESANSTTQEAP